jgi:hypothetical protein
VNRCGSSLSEGRAGDVHGGDRLPRELIVLMFCFVADRADKPSTVLAFEWEGEQKIAGIEREMQLAVHRRSARLHVCDIGEMCIRPAREPICSASRTLECAPSHHAM